MKLKQLNYKSIEELERQINKRELLSPDKDDGHFLVLKFEKLNKQLKQDSTKGDEELNFLNYSKLLILINHLKQTQIYKNDSSYCDLMGINDTNAKTYTEIRSQLRNDLIKRYKLETALNSTIPTSINESNSLAKTKDYVTCKELFDLFNQLITKNANLLLIDLRRREDFNKSSIYFNDSKLAACLIAINIPEDKLLKGFTCTSIESILNQNELNQFRARNQVNSVILMDYESTSINSNDKLYIFYQALAKFDTTPYRLKKDPLFLKGGFNDWLMHYPMYCTDSAPNFNSTNLDIKNEQDNSRSDQMNSSQDEELHNRFNNLFSSNSFGGDAVERIYSRNKDQNQKLPGSAQFFRNASTTSNNFNHNLFNSSNSFLRPNENEISTISRNQKDLNKRNVIYHKIEREKYDDEEVEDNSNHQNLILNNLQPPFNETTFLSKPISAFKNESTKNEYGSSFNETSSIFSNNLSSLSNSRRSKSYTNLTDSTIEDEDENNNNNQFASFANKPSFDRSNKPSSFDRPNRSSLSALREFSPILGTSYHPTGLKNLGNTCFMNAVIQCLFNVKYFTDYFIDKLYLSDINRNSKFGTRGELTEEFGVLMSEMANPQVKHISPKDFRRIVGKHISAYSGNEQQDSHEFLLILFEKLHADLNRAQLIKNQIEIPDSLGSQEAIERFWRNHLENNNSKISEIFEGLIMSTLECKDCQKKSNTFEVFTCLSLPIPTSNLGTRSDLEDCLKEYTKNELMCDEAAWECPTCKVKRPAIKKTSIVRLPKVLIIHLKR